MRLFKFETKKINLNSAADVYFFISFFYLKQIPLQN